MVIIDTSTGAGGPGQGPQGPWAGSGGGRPGSDGRVIGEVDQFAAPVLVHDDAIYLHDGRQYHVERLDWEEKRAYVHPIDVDHYTLAETRTTLQILERYEGPVGDVCRRSLGEVRVSRLATMYKKVRFLTQENVGAGPITLPEQDLHTISAWIAFDPQRLAGIDRAELDAGLERRRRRPALRGLPALHVRSARPRQPGADARGAVARRLCSARPPRRHGAQTSLPEFVAGWRPTGAREALAAEIGWPTVYIYDAVAGGVGFAERCHQRHDELVTMAARLVDRLRVRHRLSVVRGPGPGSCGRQGGHPVSPRDRAGAVSRRGRVGEVKAVAGPARSPAASARRPLRSPAAIAKYIAQRRPRVRAVVRAAGPFAPRPPSGDPFNALARAIAYQQLAGRAAAAIHGRFLALYGTEPPTPAAVLATPVERLRACGLSGAKTAAILDLALKFSDGTVPLVRLADMPDDEVVARLSEVRGVGRWTAEMFLLFDLRRPDVWPVDDYGVRKGWTVIHGLPAMPAPRELTALADPLRPHRSAAAWFCWRAMDTVLP